MRTASAAAVASVLFFLGQECKAQPGGGSVTLLVRARTDGSLESLALEVEPGQKPEQLSKTSSAVAALVPGSAVSNFADALKNSLPEEMKQLYKMLGLPRTLTLHVAADARLRFDHAAAVIDVCRQAGFTHIELVRPEARAVRLRVSKDGKVSLNGKPVSGEQLKERLAWHARAGGGADKLQVTVEATPDTRYSAVISVVQVVQGVGCRNVHLKPTGEPEKK
jgi:biopolymer transport protein ExbD